MNFTIKALMFKVGLAPAIMTSNTNPKREYPDIDRITFTVNKDNIVVKAHNGNVGINHVVDISTVGEMELNVEETGTVTVKGSELQSILESFGDEKVQVEQINNELFIRLVSDKEQFQSLLVQEGEVTLPVIAKTFSKEANIRRDLLIYGIDKVLFAIGFEKSREKSQYMHWKLTLDKSLMAFSCGDGARFIRREIENPNITVSKNMTFCIHKDQSSVLTKLLATFIDENLTIGEYVRSKKSENDEVDQFVIKIGKSEIILVGHDSAVNWPDETKFVKRENGYKFVTPIKEWTQSLKGIRATYSEDMRKQSVLHITKMQMIANKDTLVVKSENTMKAVRKVKLKDSQFPGEAKEINFDCLTVYVSEVERNASDSENIQIEFVDDKKPVVIKFYAGDKISNGPFEKVNNDTKERCTIFFGGVN